MAVDPTFDVVIVGGGIGGVICLKYANEAGLNALLLERRERIGGLWRDLPAWQDIQIRKEDWTLGDLPMADEYQPAVLRNIEAWVDRFGLAPQIRLNAPVIRASRDEQAWRVDTDSEVYTAKALICATGGHNRSVIPSVQRLESSIVEFHSSQLPDPEMLRNKRVTVVGGGASAYDLLDLCFAHHARRVVWIYRSTKWIRPTRRAKYFGSDMRLLAKLQMLGLSVNRLNQRVNQELRARYAKAGIEAIKPDGDFDISRHQLVPGRPRMIENFAGIERHRAEVQSLQGNSVFLSTGESFDTDLLLWGTGYSFDLDYLGVESLSNARHLNDIAARCHSLFRSMDATNLFLLAPGVLETNTATPWAYAHAARSIMHHIGGENIFDQPPRKLLTNHFDVVKLLAGRDRKSYPFGRWYLRYLWLALFHPRGLPLPIP